MITKEEILKPYEQQLSDGAGGFDTVYDHKDVLKCMKEYAQQNAIEFAEYMDSEGFQQYKVGGTWRNVRDSHIPESQEFTTAELYQKFLVKNTKI